MNLPMKLFNYGIFEPTYFKMERKLLLTLKQRAEEFSLNHKSELELMAEKITV